MEAPAVILPIDLRAVLGSKRSLTIAQKPDTRIAPNAVMWRYTRMAVTRGASDARPHSADSKKALSRNSRGTRRAGRLRAMTRARRMVTVPERTAAAMTMDGNATTPKVDRKRASRVALPAS